MMLEHTEARAYTDAAGGLQYAPTPGPRPVSAEHAAALEQARRFANKEAVGG